MNRGWCKYRMGCKLHHPKWDTEEHWRLQQEYNDNNGRTRFGGKKHDYNKTQAWGSGWKKQDDQRQGENKWKQDPQQGTGRSSWQEEHKEQSDQEPKTYVYRDLQNWHHIKLRIPESVTASIEKDKSKTNRDTEELLARITEAAMDLIDLIHYKR